MWRHYINELSVLPWWKGFFYAHYTAHMTHISWGYECNSNNKILCLSDKELKELFKMMMLKMFMPVSIFLFSIFLFLFSIQPSLPFTFQRLIEYFQSMPKMPESEKKEEESAESREEKKEQVIFFIIIKQKNRHNSL